MDLHIILDIDQTLIDNMSSYEYEKNKEKIKEHGSNNLKKLKEENPEILQKYRRTYYLKRKERLNKEQN